MEEKNKKYLQNKLEQLPEVDPPAALWKQIEGQLDFQDKLNYEMVQLPEIDPSVEIWSKIEHALDGNTAPKSKVIQLRTYFAYASSIAAAIILIVLFGIPSNRTKVEMTYSVEPEQLSFTDQFKTDSETNALAFINYTCSLQLDICETEEFKGLKNQLDDLTIEIEQINEQLAIAEDNPYLMKAQIQVENMRADITKRLITIITT